MYLTRIKTFWGFITRDRRIEDIPLKSAED